MAVAKAWSTAEFIVKVKIKEARLTLATMAPFYMLLAIAKASFRIARRNVVI